MANIQKITPNLWFDKNGEDATDFYISIFPNSSKGRVSRFGKEGFEIHHMPEGTAMTIEFNLNGQNFLALNGGPIFKFNEAVSFVIDCENQEEVDHYWNKLSEGGPENAQQCGWLKDKFGLSWQVVPKQLAQLMTGPDKAASGRVMNAMLKMKKIIIVDLEKAYRGE